MKVWSRAVLGLSILATGTGAFSQASTAFTLTASYDREGLPVPQWKIQVEPNGAAEYTSHHASAGIADTPVRFQLSRTGQAKLGQWLAASGGLVPCETKTKNLARMGTKTLTYVPAGGASVTCTYNYSDNKFVSQVMEYLMQTSSTIEEGAAINRLHRFDRLGLDPVLIRLTAAAKDGKAQELGAIRPSLEALVADEAILERVRQRAAALLELAKLQ